MIRLDSRGLVRGTTGWYPVAGVCRRPRVCAVARQRPVLDLLRPWGSGGMGADAMSAPGYVPGRCSACDGRAERSPVSGHWWHLGRWCPQTSMLCFQPVRWYEDGTVGPTGAANRPARFVADAP